LNIQQTIEVAALISAHSAHLIEHAPALPERPLGEYWLHSRNRLSAWLSCFEKHASQHGDEAGWDRWQGVCEEVFQADILSRVWGAVLTAADRHRKLTLAEPIARNVMIGQMQARHIALRSMVDAGSGHSKRISQIDKVRRRSERWTDVLLGHLVLRYDVDDFAFDASRAREFGEEQTHHEIRRAQSPAWELIFAGMRVAFSAQTVRTTTRDAHHRDIVNTVLRTFPADAFEADGPFKSLAHLRIERGTGIAETAPAPITIGGPVSRTGRQSEPASERSAGTLDGQQGVSFAKARRIFRSHS
jgi:hypothetical protein